MSAADRGKGLESEFRNECKKYERMSRFAFHRYPDLRAGSRVPAPADFQTCYNGQLRLVELKETLTEGRLPYANFDKDQVARMRLWDMAGGESWVIVLHKKSGLYRALRVDYFRERKEKQGSWFFEMESEAPLPEHEELTTKSISDVFRYIHKM